MYRQLVALYSAYQKRVGDISSVVVRARDDLTFFCDIYNVFLMFLIDFFVLNSNPMSASFKSLSIFVDSRSKVNIKVKYDFLRNEARNKCNTLFPCDLPWQSISKTFLTIQGHLQGQFQGQVRENISFNK